MKIGLQELILVFIVALVVLGPDKLPEYARKLGEALAVLKKYSQEATKDIRENITEPLNEAQKPLREAMEPLHDLQKEMQSSADEIKKSFTDIGKPNGKTARAASPEEKTVKAEARADAGTPADAQDTETAKSTEANTAETANTQSAETKTAETANTQSAAAETAEAAKTHSAEAETAEATKAQSAETKTAENAAGSAPVQEADA